MFLSQLKRGQSAVVVRVDDQVDGDVIAGRLRRIGFAPGERVSLRHVGPFGSEPMLFQVGTTRFALRRAEAQRVVVTKEATA